MNFERLAITNFMAISEAEIKLHQRGLVLIQGKNEDNTAADSNGAGKSSIADALCWCLFGETARGVSGDDVVNNIAGKGTVVSVVIEDDGILYQVSRYRKHKTGKNSVQIQKLDVDASGVMTTTDLSKGTDKLTQEVVDKIVGCSYDVFRTVIYSGQEQMPDIPGMSDKQLKVLVEEASGTAILEGAYALARSALRDADTAVHARSIVIEGHKAKIAYFIKTRDELEVKKRAWEVGRKTRFEAEVKQTKAITENIRSTHAAIDEAAFKAASARLDALKATKNRHSDKLRQCDVAKAEVSRISNEGARYDLQMAEMTKRQDAAQSIVNELLAGHSTLCPACKQAVKPSEVTIREHQEEAFQFGKQVKDLHDKKETLLKDDMKKAIEKLTEIEEEVLILGSEVDRASSDFLLVNQVEKKIIEIEGMNRTLRIHYQASLNIKFEVNPYSSMLTAAINDIALSEETLKQENIKHDGEKKLLTVAEAAAEVFAPAGVRARILDEVTPYLNAQTAKYLGALTDGSITATWSTLTATAKGELKEKFAIDVEDATGGKSFKALSGGEKRKVRIASALAIQDLVSRRAVKPIDLFIGDEIDDALDASGQERLMTVLDGKAKECGTVLIISHADLKDWIPNLITVTKKDGKSTLVEETV